MLRSLGLTNFRGFSDHKIEFCPETILIGQNNAGKTTAIEALRALSVAQSRINTAVYIAPPNWLSGICQGAGYKVSLDTIDFDFTNVQHAYDTSRPAIIKAKLRNNSEVHVFIGRSSEEVFCQLRPSSTKIIHSRSEVGNRSFGNIRVMPPIGSLLAHEKILSKDRLSRYLNSYLAYRHFRNQLWERPADYRLFKQLLTDTWHGLTIQHFENDHGDGGNEFSLLVREGRFTSEISWHGHGLQAWMQTIWFLARTPKTATIVLDEPDVYLHADLQRKLIKVIENLGFTQAIMATHSSEIIGDVPFQNVTVIQKQERVSKPADNAAEIQRHFEEWEASTAFNFQK
jgi:AAA domain, putative AbiEii toxin, Type IV TA system